MGLPDNRLHIFSNGVLERIGPSAESERAYLESLIRADYKRCHPDETLEDLKHRARFSKEHKGLLGDWMAVAAFRAASARREKLLATPPLAATRAGLVRRPAAHLSASGI